MKKLFLITAVCTLSVTAFSIPKNLKIATIKTKLADDVNKVKFILDDKTFDVQSYNLIFNPNKENNNPLYNYQNTSLSISVKASKIDQALLDWLLSPEQTPKSAQIIVADPETGKVLKTLTFTGVTTGSYNDSYSGNNNYIVVNQYTNLNLRYKTLSIKLENRK